MMKRLLISSRNEQTSRKLGAITEHEKNKVNDERDGPFQRRDVPYLAIAPLAFVLFSCMNESGYVITARITGIPNGTKMMLQNVSTGINIDSAVVADHAFSFRGQLNAVPEELRIISGLEELKKGNLFYTDLLIGNEIVQVEGDVSDLPNNITTSGSPTQKEAEVYRKEFRQWESRIDSLRAALKSVPDSIDHLRYQSEQRILEATSAFDKWQVTYLMEHFNSYIALLMYNYRRDFSTKVLDSLYATLSDKLRDSKYGKAIQTQIQFPMPNAGQTFYDFQSTDINGKLINLSAINDKYILLQFAGTGCYGSNLAINHMKEIHDRYSDSVAFVSTFFEPRSQFQEYAEGYAIPWISTWFPDGKYGEPAVKYGIVGTPTFYLISPEKRVVARWIGFEDGIIEMKLNDHLGH
jgi:hypothetical protein